MRVDRGNPGGVAEYSSDRRLRGEARKEVRESGMGFRGDATGFGRGGGMIWPVVSAAGLIGSLASFQWGMRKFFTQPAGDNAGLKLIRVCGSAFALLHPHGHCRHTPRRRVASSGRRLLVFIRPGPVLVGHPRQSGPTAFRRVFSGRSSPPGAAGPLSRGAPPSVLFLSAGLDRGRRRHGPPMAHPYRARHGNRLRARGRRGGR